MKFNFYNKKLALILIGAFFFSFFLVSAFDISSDSNLDGVTGVNIIIPETPINYSLIPTVNNTDHFGGYTPASYADVLKAYFDGFYCLLTGCTMEGDIDMDENDINNVNEVNATTLLATNNIVVGNETASASFRGLGDIYAIGSIKTMEGVYAESKAYGAGLEIMDNNLTVTHHNIITGDATLTASTKVITDTSASYTDAYEGQFLRVISSTPSFTGATGEITEVIDGTHLVLSFATSGIDTIVDATGMSYVIYPHPNFFVGDNGVVSVNIGENEDAKFEIHIDNGTGFHGVYIEDAAGADQHQAFTIDVDSKSFDGVVGANIFMSSSTGANGISGSALLLEGNADGFENSHMGFIDVNFLGQGTNNDVDILHIQGLPPEAHIIHSGEPDDITKAYYDNGDGTTSDATTAFTSQGTDITLFENDNSIIYIGNTENFTSIGISFSTEGNKNILAEYYYCDSSDAWKELPGVIDTTNGMTTSGTISFANPSDRGTCNDEIDNTNFANTTDYTYIAIKRTRTAYPGQKPIENLITISGGGEYFYVDKYGMKPIGSSSAPYTCESSIAGMTYHDTTANALLWCDGSTWIEFAETADITVHNNLGGLQGGVATEYYHLNASQHSTFLGWFDGTTNMTVDTISSDRITSPQNENTYLDIDRYYGFRIISDSVVSMSFGSGLMEINPDAIDYDLRYRGDNDDALLYIDGGNDRIGIGDSSPSTKLEVNGNITADYFFGDISQATGISAGDVSNNTDGEYNFSMNSNYDLTTTGTITGEQITSTDDINMAGKFINDMGTTDIYGIDLNQPNYLGTNTLQLISNTGVLNTAAGSLPMSIIGMYNEINNNHVIDGTEFIENGGTYGIQNYVTVSGSHSGYADISFDETNIASLNQVFREGAVSGTNFNIKNYGTISTINAGTMTISSNVALTNYGESISVSSPSGNGGTSTSYGLFIHSVSGADTNWAYYNNANGVDNYMGNDNSRAVFGTGQDSFTYWDGTNQIWNTTSGFLEVRNNSGLGKVRALEFITSTPKDLLYSSNEKYIDTLPTPDNLFDENGKIKQGALRQSQKVVQEKDSSNCWEALYKTEYCYTLIDNNITCQDTQIDKWKSHPEYIRNEEIKETYIEECGTKPVNVTSIDTQAFENTIMISELKEYISQLETRIVELEK